jgi:catechol 2,3-dioxygenase-like lactoylglutathione lyase family enzyme
MTRIAAGLIACCFSGFLLAQGTASAPGKEAAEAPLRLGNFSVSLSVKDIAKSREFYEKLGFRVAGGNQARNWLVMQNGTATIGLFQGFFEKNSLTFNPGWDSNKQTLPAFDDVRDIQQVLKSRGLTLDKQADPSTTGPAYVTLTDPDGNPVLIDQHVAKPAK